MSAFVFNDPSYAIDDFLDRQITLLQTSSELIFKIRSLSEGLAPDRSIKIVNAMADAVDVHLVALLEAQQLPRMQ